MSVATAYDVARLAGVSVTTVSHVLNGTRHVNADTKSRVLQAVEQLGYQPNMLARALVRQETETIALIVPDNVNSFFAELARGIENHGFAAGFNVILCNSDGDAAKERAYLSMLISKRVDGVIYMTSDPGTEQLKPLLAHHIPTVTFDRDNLGIDAVMIDDFGGGYAAATHLLELGHRRIACISGPDPERDPGSGARVRGYLQALQEAGIAADPGLMAVGNWSSESGWRAVEQFLCHAVRPTAIFACNDLMAIGAVACLREMGIEVPRQMSIVGFDDIALARFASPPLTTMATPIIGVGQCLCQLLLDRISGRLPSEPQQVMVRGELRVRKSTAPLTKDGGSGA